MISRIQKHTIDIYNLENRPYQIRIIPARNLLSEHRFDLFAKLYYIRNYKQNPNEATKIYAAHIKAFNPDWKEPGREDKQSLEDFLSTFNFLIDFFKYNEFDSYKSIIPVSQDNIILDGAHRIAALAFWNKNVVIAQFENIKPKCSFNYLYFKKRGLSDKISYEIAYEMFHWKNNVQITSIITPLLYYLTHQKEIQQTIKEIDHIYKISLYSTNDSYNRFLDNLGLNAKKHHNKYLKFKFNHIHIIFSNNNIKGHSVNINSEIQVIQNSDNIEQTSFMLLKNEGLRKWLYYYKQTTIIHYILKVLEDFSFFLKHIFWVRIKTSLASFYFSKK